MTTALFASWVCMMPACTVPTQGSSTQANGLEDIYILRSIREEQSPSFECPSSKTGFEPFPTDAERFFSFWSIQTRTEDGKAINAKHTRVAELRGCLGATSDRARQNFHAQIKLGTLSFQGKGECVALMLDVPETGMFPVRCHLILSDLPAPFVGGLLTTNTMTSGARFGGDTQPQGYTQASIATIRLWKARTSH